ncbi:MAG: very short patch repair endonuclease [Prosthecobacter sp.]|uniref:very short patch repair endonuclease n=1 Tax=Prosthecobacter sp. TaxID=1965333 RepID=UPI0025FAA88D|nr:very short patch repair endonuclease [Prosthecobacter sp.]MCF7784675.1 very short patch repair endonuclease [Prosthecobacter sp.]
MPDVFTPAKRSAVMSLIRSTGNAATELRLMALLRAQKITGWRRHLSLPLPPPKAKARVGEKKPRKPRVRPDFVFRQQRLAVFVDGCFWHGCPRHATRPRQNRQFWDDKITRNRQRDRHVTRALRQTGWTVLRLWECALTFKQQARTMGRLRRALGSVERGLQSAAPRSKRRSALLPAAPTHRESA